MKAYDGRAFLVIGSAGIALALALYFDTHHTPEVKSKEIELGRIKTRPKREHKRNTIEDAVETTEKEIGNIAVFRAAQKEKEKKEIDKYNEEQELYTGNGDVASKRLYFARQAYKQARTSVPIRPTSRALVTNDDEEEEEFVSIMNELEDDKAMDDKKDTTEVIIEPIEQPRIIPPPRKVVIPKELWERRDPPRFHSSEPSI